jgi:hypothetical protein
MRGGIFESRPAARTDPARGCGSIAGRVSDRTSAARVAVVLVAAAPGKRLQSRKSKKLPP